MKAPLNPAKDLMTEAEVSVYKIIMKRGKYGKTTKSGDVATEWGGKNRSYCHKVIKSLIEKGFVEKYKHRYYRISNQAGVTNA